MTELPKWATELKWDGFDFLPLGEIPNRWAVEIYRAACIEIEKLRGEQLSPTRDGSGDCSECGGRWAEDMRCGLRCGHAGCPFRATDLTPSSPGVKTDPET